MLSIAPRSQPPLRPESDIFQDEPVLDKIAEAVHLIIGEIKPEPEEDKNYVPGYVAHRMALDAPPKVLQSLSQLGFTVDHVEGQSRIVAPENRYVVATSFVIWQAKSKSAGKVRVAPKGRVSAEFYEPNEAFIMQPPLPFSFEANMEKTAQHYAVVWRITPAITVDEITHEKINTEFLDIYIGLPDPTRSTATTLRCIKLRQIGLHDLGSTGMALRNVEPPVDPEITLGELASGN